MIRIVFIIFVLITNVAKSSQDPEEVKVAKVIKCNVLVEIKPLTVEFEYTRSGDPFLQKRENYFAIRSRKNEKGKELFNVAAQATEEIYWNGNSFILDLAGGRQLCFLILRDSWDGEDPRWKDLLIFTDGEIVKMIKPEMSSKTDYEAEIRKIVMDFAQNKIEEKMIEKIQHQILGLRNRSY